MLFQKLKMGKKLVYWRWWLKAVIMVLLIVLVLSAPVWVIAKENNVFTSFWDSLASLLLKKSKPTPTPIPVKKQIFKQTVESQLKLSPTLSALIPTNSLSQQELTLPEGMLEKKIDYRQYPEMIKPFLSNSLLEKTALQYATDSAKVNFINSNIAVVDSSSSEEKFVFIKPGYCTMRLFMPVISGKQEKSMTQKSYEEVKMLDCRSKRN